MAWGGQAERKEEEKRKKEEAPRLESLMAKKKIEVETKVRESCKRSELVNLHNPCTEWSTIAL